MSRINREDADVLAQKILESEFDSPPVEEALATDEKIIARITDGIYRQPASAIRELISNAYDADATEVVVDTDFPRFEKITIRDNGIGMDEKSLANLIKHIGGSAKRDSYGSEIGVTNSQDSSLSIGGRTIIGKIGIGLFSVAQLTQQFQIITKKKGNNYRLVADVLLKTYSEDELDNSEDILTSGKVKINRIRADDVEKSGTDITLFNLRKSALDMLRSSDIWAKVDDAETERERDNYKPSYHIGRYDQRVSGDFYQTHEMSLPWDEHEDPKARFKKVYQSLLDEIEAKTANPTLENTFDNYFQMLWTLSLCCPLNYIQKHPFDLTSRDDPLFFKIENKKGVQALEIEDLDASYKEQNIVSYPIEDPVGGFCVFIDGMELYRPIAFNDQKRSQNVLKTPLMFYGEFSADFGGYDKSITGGGLSFEAYFYWNSKILPLNHNGMLIRINNASGTLFDSSFMSYPVAEKTTLGQITAEVYVKNGLDSALNIDRESFNYSHPHYQMLMKWVHNALRQVTAKQKKLRSEANKQKNIEKNLINIDSLYEFAVTEGIVSDLSEIPQIFNNQNDLDAYRLEGGEAFMLDEYLTSKVSNLDVEKTRLVMAFLNEKGFMKKSNHEEKNSIAQSIAKIIIFNK